MICLMVALVSVAWGAWWSREALRMRRSYNEWRDIATDYKRELKETQARIHIQAQAYEHRLTERHTEYVPVVAVPTVSDRKPS